MKIDCRKLKLRGFTVDLDGQELDRALRTLLTVEVDIDNVEYPDKQESDMFDEVYKSKLVGSVIVKQGTKKPILTKSKRSQSQKLRQAMWCINPSEEFYEIEMNKIIINLEEVIQYLKNK